MKDARLNQPDELYGKTKVAILHRIAQNMENHIERLPPESELAGQLGVSRVLVRDVLAELESRGYISRKHGKGTVINAPVCRASSRIDEQISFAELISSKGLTPRTELLQERWMAGAETGLPGDAEILRDARPVLRLERLIYGDNRPLIYNELFYRGDNIAADYKKWDGYGSLPPNEFLELFCKTQSTVTLAELDLCLADAVLAGRLSLDVGAPLFRMDDVRYNFDGAEVARGRTVFCRQVLPLKLVRHNS